MSDPAERKTISLQLNFIARAIQAAVLSSTEVVDFCFDAMSQADLEKRPKAFADDLIRFQFSSRDLSADERRTMYENWILAKAFQDLIRGLRASLEEAYVLMEVTSTRHRVKSNSTLAELFDPYRLRAARMRFPQLLLEINSRLTTPLEFSDAIESLQRARNCLEHRGGIVGREDLTDGEKMELRFPRPKIFYYRQGVEIEVSADAAIDADDGKPDVEILMRIVPREKSFALGRRLNLSASDFNEIAFACYYFGSQLVEKIRRTNPSQV